MTSESNNDQSRDIILVSVGAAQSGKSTMLGKTAEITGSMNQRYVAKYKFDAKHLTGDDFDGYRFLFDKLKHEIFQRETIYPTCKQIYKPGQTFIDTPGNKSVFTEKKNKKHQISFSHRFFFACVCFVFKICVFAQSQSKTLRTIAIQKLAKKKKKKKIKTILEINFAGGICF